MAFTLVSGLVFSLVLAAAFALFGALLLRTGCYAYNLFVGAPTAPPAQAGESLPYAAIPPTALPPNGNWAGDPAPISTGPAPSDLAPVVLAEATPPPGMAGPSTAAINPYASPQTAPAPGDLGPGGIGRDYPGAGVLFPSLIWAFGVMFAAIVAYWGTVVLMLAAIDGLFPVSGRPPEAMKLFGVVYGLGPLAASTTLFLFLWLGLPTYWHRALIVTLLTAALGFLACVALGFVVGMAVWALRSG